ncbi:MAG: TIGR02450 family Trp-rich protein [Polynucleobacter sp.]
MPSKTKTLLSPKKLLLSKWTAVQPINKQKHFLVRKVILPEPPSEKIEFVEIEAVFSKKVNLIPWRDLTNGELWLQGWL